MGRIAESVPSTRADDERVYAALANRTYPTQQPRPWHVLFDFGQVICLPQPRESVEKMAELAGLSVPDLEAGYWRYRNEYDDGWSGAQYWTHIIGTEPGPEQLTQLIKADVDSWLFLDPQMVDYISELHERNIPVSLLSNAPHDFADAVRHHPVLSRFQHRLFSCELEMIKPDPNIFVRTSEILGTALPDIIFIDDRIENVESASRLRIQAIHHKSPAETRAQVEQLLGRVS